MSLQSSSIPRAISTAPSGAASATGAAVEPSPRCVERKDGKKLILFEIAKKSSNYWDFISLAAIPVEERKFKNYTSSHAVCAWCLKCNCAVDFVKGSSAGVKAHLREKHPAHLQKQTVELKAKSSKASSGSLASGPLVQLSIQDLFTSASSVYMPKASPADQKRGEALLLCWIVGSVRAFKILEDKGFIAFCEFLNGLKTKFRVTSRTELSKQVKKLNSAVSIHVKHSILTEMDWFCVTTDIWTSRTMEGFMAVTLHYLSPNFQMKEFVLEVRQFGAAHTADNIR